jgi:predicted NUDIX family NTP pyrophosphohydrolase
LADEDPLDAAKREFREETGLSVEGEFHPLAPVKQPSGKVIHAWAVESDCDPAQIRSNLFPMEWPRGSGTIREFPEVDRAAWFEVGEARRRILPGQVNFLDQIVGVLGIQEDGTSMETVTPPQGSLF